MQFVLASGVLYLCACEINSAQCTWLCASLWFTLLIYASFGEAYVQYVGDFEVCVNKFQLYFCMFLIPDLSCCYRAKLVAWKQRVDGSQRGEGQSVNQELSKQAVTTIKTVLSPVE